MNRMHRVTEALTMRPWRNVGWLMELISMLTRFDT